jgi:NACalpha-BTF3-like transcription factor
MEKVTLEKVDMVRERTGVTYEKAKQALEASEGDVLEALIYIEKTQDTSDKSEASEGEFQNKAAVSIEELKAWIKQIVEKGNVARIKIKKDDVELIDIPVNAGIAAGIVAIAIPPILAASVIAAIATKITIEVTKEDGSVEVINTQVSKVANDVKNKANDFADMVVSKVNEIKNDIKDSKTDSKPKEYTGSSDAVYTYTVNFEEEKEKAEDKPEEKEEQKN